MTPCELWGPDGPQHNVESTVRGCVCVCMLNLFQEMVIAAATLLQRQRTCTVPCLRHRRAAMKTLFFWPPPASHSLVLLLVAGSLQDCRHGNAKHVTG